MWDLEILQQVSSLCDMISDIIMWQHCMSPFQSMFPSWYDTKTTEDTVESRCQDFISVLNAAPYEVVEISETV